MDALKLSKRELQITIKQIKSIKISNVLKRNNINIKIFNQFYFYKFYVNNIRYCIKKYLYIFEYCIKKKKTPIIYFSYIPTLLSTNFNLKKSNSVTFWKFRLYYIYVWFQIILYNTKIIILIVNLPLNQDAKYSADEWILYPRRSVSWKQRNCAQSTQNHRQSPFQIVRHLQSLNIHEHNVYRDRFFSTHLWYKHLTALKLRIFVGRYRWHHRVE